MDTIYRHEIVYESSVKSVKLEDATRILLNKAKSKILRARPKVKKLTDDLVIREALKNFTRR